MTSKIAEEFGRLFEVGFNIGILAYIKDKQIKHRFGNLYLHELQQLNFPKMLKHIVNQVISSLEREMVQKWSTFFLQKGFLCGLNFFGEYIQSVGWSEPHRLRNVEILYYQCRFSGDNSIGTYDNKNTVQWFREVLRQFEHLTEDEIERYVEKYVLQDLDIGKKGEFVNADTLMLLQNRRQVRVMCVDLSVFSIQLDEEVKNLDYVEIIRSLLLRDVGYLRSKSVFSQLRIDTESLGLDFSQDLKSYFTAFKYRDKESAKLIQAASYTYSFFQFLLETDIIKHEAPVVMNAVGYSDRSFSAMSILPENLDVLKSCYEIYKHDSSGKEINNARKQVLNRIKRSAYGSFSQGKDFIERLLAISPNNTTIVTHQEQVNGFFNSVGMVPHELMQLGLRGTMNLRDAHAELIKQALVSDATYIFLTGNPGIGKTTAIVDFLRNHLDEGFLFFYVSPRKQVNLDIIEKFKDGGELCDRRILAINTNSNFITDNSGEYTVQYLWNQRQGDFTEQSVNFRDSRNMVSRGRRKDKLNRKTEDVIQDGGNKSRGVLNSICEAIYTIVDRELSDNIVATACIQSLKKTYTGDTLKHFEKIFRNAYNERENLVIPAGMKNISSRIKHLFIMIDEITGDDGGVEFLDGINSILSKYQLMLPQHGFNTKVIVADASIVDKNVITQHLEDKSPESDKIYFRRASDTCQPLSSVPFQFKNLPATVINANSYPASSLSITYKVVVESCLFSEEMRLERNNNPSKNLQQEILQDIEVLLNRSDVEQVIVYIQDKLILAELIEKIKHQRTFEQFSDYLEIHADISEEEKEQISKYKSDVKVVFMTASGSRGLSFPKAKHILVEIPGFQIEKNLMEIIQVIYRGRGNDIIDNQDKELVFYLGESSVYYQDTPENQQLSLQESLLNLLNILLILKASIMTRIFGYGTIGRDKFIIIPIGGKSVFAAGETFSTQMANLINKLKQEQRRNRSDKLVEYVRTNLEQLLSNAEFTVNYTTECNYLDLRKSFNQFTQICHSLDKLLDFGKIEPGYISGSLLVVPIGNNSLEETYHMRVLDIANYANEELWRNMHSISYRKSYPESLRSAIKDAIELVKKLRDGVEKTQKLEQNSKRWDQYYALPLFTFISGEMMKEYFANEPNEPEDIRFRNILAAYIRLLYPVGNILPIGDKYRDFPFVVFRSYSLEEMRKKCFTDKYLLTSHELNVLNLILSKEA
ncbi:helicase-related protein [Iningainema tapete]|uniref:Helicase n=1 Tax=Iningainema tapete BLCC-T55 TaxID=2748662 RepID=A0A8J6XRQ8_9CYAN|nr:helicase-related protein [Iningainema tapete]MBD2772423.1 helicase [Iningainema tapete BLCC-T55]